MLLSELGQNPAIEVVERERIRELLDEIELGASAAEIGSRRWLKRTVAETHPAYALVLRERRKSAYGHGQPKGVEGHRPPAVPAGAPEVSLFLTPRAAEPHDVAVFAP